METQKIYKSEKKKVRNLTLTDSLNILFFSFCDVPRKVMT